MKRKSDIRWIFRKFSIFAFRLAEGREFESRFPLKQTAVAAGYGGLSFQDGKLAFYGLK